MGNATIFKFTSHMTYHINVILCNVTAKGRAIYRKEERERQLKKHGLYGEETVNLPAKKLYTVEIEITLHQACPV